MKRLLARRREENGGINSENHKNLKCHEDPSVISWEHFPFHKESAMLPSIPYVHFITHPIPSLSSPVPEERLESQKKPPSSKQNPASQTQIIHKARKGLTDPTSSTTKPQHTTRTTANNSTSRPRTRSRRPPRRCTTTSSRRTNGPQPRTCRASVPSSRSICAR